jgi:hypothetical protein
MLLERGAGSAACIGETRNGGEMSDGIPERRDRVEGLGVGGSRILKWITKKWGRRLCTGLMWLRVEVRAGLL